MPLRERYVVIEHGLSVRAIAERLHDREIISSPLLFELLSRLFFDGRYFHAGEYVFDGAVTPASVFNGLVDGEVYYRKITFPEGWSVSHIREHLLAEPYLQGDVPDVIEEGSLLPDTYHFTYGDTRGDVVLHMQQRMRLFMDAMWSKYQDNTFLESPHEVLVLASVVEKETSLDHERRRVAAVFLNRLKKRMRLQADPTVIYAASQGDVVHFDRELTKKDLRLDSPYNTYRYRGLPPAPIANPGKASIMAVLNPAVTEEYYFVADGKGGHRFASTLKEHNRNVRLYRSLGDNE